MVANPSRLGAVSYEVESAWADAVDTFGTRLQVLGEPVVPDNIQERIAEPITQQYMEEGKIGVRGPWAGEFTIRLALTGHGGTSATTLTQTDLHAVLANFFLAGNASLVGTTVGTPTSASQFTVAGGTLRAGGLIRVGALGDGRGEGQFAAINNASTITLLTALGASPNAADVVYANQMIYPPELAATSKQITSTRWLLQTANGQWKARGCFPVSYSFSGLQTGEIPAVELTYGVSRWEKDVNETFPNATATDAKDSAIVAAGSCFLQTFGTATRQTFSVRSFDLGGSMEVMPLYGPGGLDGYQTIVGAVMTRCAATVGLTVDAEASGTDTLGGFFTAGNFMHCLMSLSVSDGKAVGFYFPKMRPTSLPTQSAIDGLNRRTINFECLSDTAQSTDEAVSSWRLGLG